MFNNKAKSFRSQPGTAVTAETAAKPAATEPFSRNPAEAAEATAAAADGRLCLEGVLVDLVLVREEHLGILHVQQDALGRVVAALGGADARDIAGPCRSEERRVGKDGRLAGLETQNKDNAHLNAQGGEGVIDDE